MGLLSLLLFLLSLSSQAGEFTHKLDSENIYAQGKGLGRIVRLTSEEFIRLSQGKWVERVGARFLSDDMIVVLKEWPNAEVESLGGIILSQTPPRGFGHLLNLCQELEVPYVFWEGAYDLEAFKKLETERNTHFLEVTADGLHAVTDIAESRLPEFRSQIRIPYIPVSIASWTFQDIVSLGDLEEIEAGRQGEKSAELSRAMAITGNSFPGVAVPIGWVEKFFEQSYIGEKYLRTFIDEVSKFIKGKELRVVEQGLATIRAAIDRTPMSGVLQKEIYDSLKKHGIDVFGKMSFRSSSNALDNRADGVYSSTVLHPTLFKEDSAVRKAEIALAVKEILKSFYSLRAYRIRRRYNLDEEDVGLAVIIHEFLEEEFHGMARVIVRDEAVVVHFQTTPRNSRVTDGVDSELDEVRVGITREGEIFELKNKKRIPFVARGLLSFQTYQALLLQIETLARQKYSQRFGANGKMIIEYIIDRETKKPVLIDIKDRSIDLTQTLKSQNDVIFKSKDLDETFRNIRKNLFRDVWKAYFVLEIDGKNYIFMKENTARGGHENLVLIITKMLSEAKINGVINEFQFVFRGALKISKDGDVNVLDVLMEFSDEKTGKPYKFKKHENIQGLLEDYTFFITELFRLMAPGGGSDRRITSHMPGFSEERKLFNGSLLIDGSFKYFEKFISFLENSHSVRYAAGAEFFIQTGKLKESVKKLEGLKEVADYYFDGKQDQAVAYVFSALAEMEFFKWGELEWGDPPQDAPDIFGVSLFLSKIIPRLQKLGLERKFYPSYTLNFLPSRLFVSELTLALDFLIEEEVGMAIVRNDSVFGEDFWDLPKIHALWKVSDFADDHGLASIGEKQKLLRSVGFNSFQLLFIESFPGFKLGEKEVEEIHQQMGSFISCVTSSLSVPGYGF